MSEQLPPLRVNKTTTPGSSPQKTGAPRPLSELSPTSPRRNSPSFNQATRSMMFTKESSPFNSSSPFGGRSPHAYWQGRDSNNSTNRDSLNRFFAEKSPTPETSPARRKSLERLKASSPVKNSKIFDVERRNGYDPASAPVSIERPLAGGRPLQQYKSYGERAAEQQTRSDGSPVRGHRRGESMTKIPFLPSDGESMSKIPHLPPSNTSSPLFGSRSNAPSPVKLSNGSPVKSSLATGRWGTRSNENLPADDMWSDDDDVKAALPRALRRVNKSVTFDAAPPQINEYEMVTPDPSSVASGSREGSYESMDEYDEGDSFDRGSSADREDSFDAELEDTAKTPVVLPGDWQSMNEDAYNPDDIFDSSPAQPRHTVSVSKRPSMMARSESVTSDSSESRPLPPLPGMPALNERRDSNGLSDTAERMGAAPRSLPTPPAPSAVSKPDILNMREGSMSLEDRLRLMEIQNSPGSVRRTSKDQDFSIHVDEVEDEDDKTPEVEDYVPRISRESILRKVRSQAFDDDDDAESAILSSPRNYNYADLDPDVPIPSRECSSNFDVEVPDLPVKIKGEEEDEEVVDMYSIPEMYSAEPAQSQYDDYGREGSVIHHKFDDDKLPEDDEESRYSPDSIKDVAALNLSNSTTEDEGPPTPKPEKSDIFTLPSQRKSDVFTLPSQKEKKRMDLPDFSAILGTDDMDFGLSSFISTASDTPRESNVVEPPKHEKHDSVRDAPVEVSLIGALNLPNTHIIQSPVEDAPVSPQEQSTEHSMYSEKSEESMISDADAGAEEDERSDSPDSVIHHPMPIEPPQRDSPVIPERQATIKSPGGHLKTRPSVTPADMSQLRAARRQISGQHDGFDPDSSEDSFSDGMDYDEESTLSGDNASPTEMTRRQSMKLKLEIPTSAMDGDFFGLDKDFDRVIEQQKQLFSRQQYETHEYNAHAPPTNTAAAEYIGVEPFTHQPKNVANVSPRKQRGYLMRQNTKVVVASSRQFSDEMKAAYPDGTRSAGSSPRKASAERKQFLTTEPWNGKVRRKSTRQSSGGRHKTAMQIGGPVPPLPGQESVVSGGLGTVVEGDTMDEIEDGVERGRVFVKVVGVKDLDLPLPNHERTWFQLTLDNGLHCVTTAWLELGRSAPIGQEFELVVLNELEFQLTLQTKLTPPPRPVTPITRHAAAAPKPAKAQKSSVFNRLLGSPKKKKDAELRRQQEEAERAAEEEREREREAKRNRAPPSAWDLLHNLVAPDGSFARAYVSMKGYEQQAFGRPMTVDVPCFNEWAVQDDLTASSVKSKHGNVMRRPPYKVGKLTLQLLYVPKPRAAKDEDMPKSMNAAIRQLNEAEQVVTTNWEGILSQQGGDCPYWRRRFFRLNGTKLTAYHESTRQPRCTMNLAKAQKLIAEKSSLLQPGEEKGGKPRRKSGFGEEEDGYMFVEEGFRIRFANGECIDFYADSAADKQGWMKALSEVIGKDASNAGKAWTEIVLARERSLKKKEVPNAPHPPRKDGHRESISTSADHVPMAPPPKGRGYPKSAPTSPMKQQRPETMQPPPREQRRPTHERHRSDLGGGQESFQDRQQKTRSMIF